MQLKKTKKADIERKRGTLFLLGLILSMSVVLLAFNWNTKIGIHEIDGMIQRSTDDDIYIPPVTERQKEPERRLIKEAVIFELVDNDVKINNEIDFFESDVLKGDIFSLDNIFQNQPKEKPDDVPEIFNWVENMPEFPGGELALLNFLNKSVKYPVIAQENGIQGKVYISFVIDKNGNVINVDISRSVDTVLDNEALRVVKSMPKWKPGRQGGRCVNVSYTVPIKFVLQ